MLPQNQDRNRERTGTGRWADLGTAKGRLGARGLKTGDVIGRTCLPFPCCVEPLEGGETGEAVLAF